MSSTPATTGRQNAHVADMQFRALAAGSNHPNGWPCRLLVTSQSEARRFHTSLGATHVLSIKGTRTRYLGPKDLPQVHHLLMVFNDVPDAAHSVPPTAEHIEEMQRWMLALPGDAALIIHCLQGVHRSAATALGFLAQQVAPPEAMSLLRQIRPEAMPNPLVVSLWDRFLALDGALIAATGASGKP